MSDDLERMITADDLAKVWLVSTRTIRNRLRGKDPPPHYRIGGTVRFKWSEVEEWLKRHRIQTVMESQFEQLAENLLRKLRLSSAKLRLTRETPRGSDRRKEDNNERKSQRNGE